MKRNHKRAHNDEGTKIKSSKKKGGKESLNASVRETIRKKKAEKSSGRFISAVKKKVCVCVCPSIGNQWMSLQAT